jgi:hypothetical protein
MVCFINGCDERGSNSSEWKKVSVEQLCKHSQNWTQYTVPINSLIPKL